MLSSILVFGCSIFVNAYFQVTSFSALVRWFLKISGTGNAPEHLAEILARTDTPVGMRIAFGLLMTVFVMAFLLIAALVMNAWSNVGFTYLDKSGRIVYDNVSEEDYSQKLNIGMFNHI